MSHLHKPFVWWRHCPGFRQPPGELSRAAKRCLTPKGDEKCLAITRPVAPPSLISFRCQALSRATLARPTKRTLRVINLRNGADQDQLAIDPKRTSFRTARKQYLNTSGVTKDRSMTEPAARTADKAKLGELRPVLVRPETIAP
jgi:hypothetical protein